MRKNKRKKIVAMLAATLCLSTFGGGICMASTDTGSFDFILYPHGNSNKSGSVEKTGTKEYANIYISSASNLSPNNKVGFRVRFLSDDSAATAYALRSSKESFRISKLAGVDYKAGVRYYLKAATDSSADNTAKISGTWRP